MRLKSKLLSLNSDKSLKTKVYSPANTEELRIPFKIDKTAKVVGKLAQVPPPITPDQDARLVTGVLVQNDFKMSLMAPEDLREYAGLTTTTILCKQRITLSTAGIDLIRWALEGTFGSIEEIGPKNKMGNGFVKSNGNTGEHGEEVAEEDIDRFPNAIAYLVMGCVIVRYEPQGEVELEWEGNMLNDGIADAVLAALFTVESSPAAVKREDSFTLGSYTLTGLKNRPKFTHIAITILNKIPMRTLRPRSVSRACACSSKRNLALRSRRSLALSSCQKRPSSPTMATRSKVNTKTRMTWMAQRLIWLIWRPKSWNASTASAFPSRAWRLWWINMWPGCGSRLSRWNAHMEC